MKTLAEVSVIIPCYRCQNTIDRAIKSVAAQTMLPAQVILVDDHSDDGQRTLHSLEALKIAYPEIPITILQLPENRGPGSARNEGWKHATQSYIAFLDADDAWHPKKLEIQSSWMAAHPQVMLSAHPSVNLSKKSPTELPKQLHVKQVSMDALLLSNFLPCRSVMLKSGIKERFLERKRQAEDYLLWLNIGFQGGHIWFLNQPLAYSYKDDFGQQGLNANLEASYNGVLETYRLIYQRGFISAPKYYFLLLTGFIKHLRRKVLSVWHSQ